MKFLFALVLIRTALAAPQMAANRVAHLTSGVESAANLLDIQAGTQQRTSQAQPWEHYAFYVVAVLLILVTIGVVVKAVMGPPKPQTLTEVAEAKADVKKQVAELTEIEKEFARKEAGEDIEAAAPDDDDEEYEEVDYEKLLRTFAQAAAQQIGPKLAKGQAVRNIFETKVNTIASKTRTFVLDEIQGTAGQVLAALGAQEAMLLLDWESAMEASFPPASILLAGVLSPVLLGLAQLNHIAQALLFYLPVVCLCIASIIIDEGQPCDAIPTIYYWLWATAFFGVILFFAHIGNFLKIIAGKAWLRKEIDEVSAKLKDIQSHSHAGLQGLQDLREFFVCNCVIIQKALLVEDGVRRSIFNNIIGICTMIWLYIITVWCFILVLGWTFVPGTIAFHHSAHEAAGDDYCGAWMTVLTARLFCIIGIIFLGINIMTVNAWFSDALKYNPEYEKLVLGNAKKIDDGAGGIPVAQTLVKAFVLRGSSDTLEMQMNGVNMEKANLAKKRYEAQAELDSVIARYATEEAKHAALKQRIQIEKGGEQKFAEQPKPQPVVKQRDLDLGADIDKKTQKKLNEAEGFMSEAKVKELTDMKDEAQKQAFLARESAKAGLDEAQQKAMESMDDAQKLAMIAAKKANLNLSEAQVKAMAAMSDAEKKKQLIIAQATAGMDEAKVQAMAAMSQAEQEAYIIAEKAQLGFNEAQIKAMAAMGEAEKQAYILAEHAQLGLDEAKMQALAALDDAEKQAFIMREKAKAGMDEAQRMALEALSIAEQEKEILKQRAMEGLSEAQKLAMEAMSEAERRVKEDALWLAQQAKEQAALLAEATKREILLMIEKIKEAAERIRNSDAVKKALAQAQEMADQAEKQLEEGIEQLKQVDLEKLAKEGKEALEKGVEQIKEKAEEIANSEEVQAAIAKGKEVGKAIQEGDVEELKRHAKEGAEFAQEKGQEAAQYAQEKGQQLKEEVEKIDVEELKKQGKEVVDKGVEKGKELAAEGAKKAGEAAEIAKEKGAEAVEIAKEKGAEAAEIAKEKGAEAAAIAKEKGAEAAQKAGEVAEQAKEKGAEAVEVAKEKGAEAAQKAGEVAEQAKEKGAEAAEIAKEKGAEAAQKAGEVAEQAKEKGAEVAEQAKEKGAEAAQKAGEVAEQAKETAKKKGGKKK